MVELAKPPECVRPPFLDPGGVAAVSCPRCGNVLAAIAPLRVEPSALHPGRGILGGMASTHVSLTYHVVFSTKERERVLVGERAERMWAMLGGCIRTAGGAPLEVGGWLDHVHLVIGLRPTHCLADVLRDVKRVTSQWFTQEFGRRFQWQEGYGAFTVCPRDVESVREYVRTQAEHHKRRTFQEEYREFLETYGIAFDERYLW